MILNLRIARLPHGADLPLPAYQSAFAAGLDLYAAVPADAPIVLAPGAQATIPNGITLALPPGTEGQVRPRSGLAARHGEAAVLLINHGQASFEVARGMRIAQLVVAPILRVTVSEAEHLEDTGRGSGGFGSTGS